MEPKLPELFGLLPKAPVTVEPIPDFAKAESTHYVAGTPDGKRPGRVVVAVADPTKRTLITDESVAYHEGVPGHHMQISIAQTLPDLPKFRLHGFYSAYAAGWALYAEELGKELGFYKDPVSDYGRLNSELFRAVRLVVDTGIHDKNWSRDKVIEYMHVFVSSRRRHTRFDCDWSSDVCSSDLHAGQGRGSEASGVDWCDGIDAATSGLGD